MICALCRVCLFSALPVCLPVFGKSVCCHTLVSLHVSCSPPYSYSPFSISKTYIYMTIVVRITWFIWLYFRSTNKFNISIQVCEYSQNLHAMSPYLRVSVFESNCTHISPFICLKFAWQMVWNTHMNIHPQSNVYMYQHNNDYIKQWIKRKYMNKTMTLQIHNECIKGKKINS